MGVGLKLGGTLNGKGKVPRVEDMLKRVHYRQIQRQTDRQTWLKTLPSRISLLSSSKQRRLPVFFTFWCTHICVPDNFLPKYYIVELISEFTSSETKELSYF